MIQNDTEESTLSGEYTVVKSNSTRCPTTTTNTGSYTPPTSTGDGSGSATTTTTPGTNNSGTSSSSGGTYTPPLSSGSGANTTTTTTPTPPTGSYTPPTSSDSGAGSTTTTTCSCHTNVDMLSAEEIEVEQLVIGSICCPGATQWFKFTAPKSGTYTIYTTGSLDTVGTLCDYCGDQIVEINDYAPCGKINFRIIQDLVAGVTYYIKVRVRGDDIGDYTLKVTKNVLADYVTLSKDTITLEKGVRYELPITADYTYKGYKGAQRIPGLSVSINPSNANEQKIWWWEEYGDVLECSYGWDDDGDRYIHVKATGIGTAKLYAEDWNENGKWGECVVTVVTPYCGGENYRDVTQHSLVLRDDGYYTCSKCGYTIKSPAIQDKDILSTDDFLKVISIMNYYTHNVLLAQKNPGLFDFYNEEARRCQIAMDTIRCQPQYSALYEYQDENSRYLASETDEFIASGVSKTTINEFTIGAYNGFYESIASIVIGYYCPQVGELFDVISLARDIANGEMDAMSFGAFIAGLLDLDDIATVLSFFSSTSDIINCDVCIGDTVIRIMFCAYACAEFIFDVNHNIKKARIDYTL